MDWTSSEKKEDGTYVIPKRWLHIHYYEALNILFRYENALRVFVYSVLKNKYFDKWDECSFGDSKSIASIAKTRISQAQSFGYLGYEVSCPIMHLTSGELVDIITTESYWPLFKPYFKGSKEIIRTKFLEINTVRNSLAHFRPIKEDDINLIQQNTKHTLMGVEEHLSEAILPKNVVPTNTADEWYQSIKPIGASPTRIDIYQSRNGDWIRVQLAYSPETLQTKAWSDSYMHFRLTSIKSPQIIRKFPSLAKYVTYVSEDTSYPTISSSGDLQNCIKLINFIFHAPVIHEYHQDIKDDLERLVLQISEETELISQDNMACGQLVEPVSMTAHLKETVDSSYWQVGTQPLKVTVAPDDPPEYWGEVDSFVNDFVAGTYIFPWMQANVSEIEFPF